MTVVWRRPARAGRGTPLVVLLHGRGADEHDLAGLAGGLPAGYAYASPRGLEPVEGGGYTWFANRGVARPAPGAVPAAVATLRAWLDGSARREFGGPCTLVGFSAGMMMAGALALDAPGRYAGAALLSGALALDDAPAAGRLAGLHVFLARGTRDDVIPAPLVAATDRYLRDRSGATLVERTYRHGHAISARETADIAAWLGGIL